MGGRDLGSDSSIERKALRVFLKTGPELANLLAPEGPAPAESSTRHTEARLDQGRFPLIFRWEMSHGVATWLEEMATVPSPRPVRRSAVFDFQPDLVITSIAPDVELLVPPEAEGTETFKANATALIEKIRQRCDASILWCNTTTVGQDVEPTNHHRLIVEPRSLKVHRLCLALVELSLELGISIIDIDRVLGEAGLGLDGGGNAERDPLPALREETLRVIEDYGYFDDRPITAQVGRIGGGGGD